MKEYLIVFQYRDGAAYCTGNYFMSAHLSAKAVQQAIEKISESLRREGKHWMGITQIVALGDTTGGKK